ncbi:insulin-like growth factor-binding protein 4 isoform X2 [Dunckerocampus dactyliophorus]|uniref:insulin-like growth factor-binding protein 4 isoform X2 n=1 Tax=Dunckerocampus dactyliophorus TaxID=161453 RepID=UPI002405D2C5|nr:insulin-like growth factor-binding protein 4 isoform X2 [Dunckerocampus dactyliophorus]
MVRGGGVAAAPSRWGLWALSTLTLAALCLSDQAIRCPVCSEERLASCQLPDDCEETVREPGCGCCPTCALSKGAHCGVYSPRCGTGLRCYPPRGIERPLHSLMHGQGVCTDEREVEENSVMEQQDEIVPEHPNNSNIRCSPQDKWCIQKTLARHPPKSTNQRSNMAREEAKAALTKAWALLSKVASSSSSSSCSIFTESSLDFMFFSPLNTISIQPSIFFHLSEVGSQGQPPKQALSPQLFCPAPSSGS